MIVYLMRHGQAGPGPDAGRQLTEEGIRAVSAVAGRARRAGARPVLVLTSTYARASETADLAARVLGYTRRIERTTALLPSGSPPEVWDEVAAHQPEGDLLLVGHEPLMSALAAFVLDAPGLKLRMGTAAMVAIEVERLGARPVGVLLWMLDSRLG